MTPEQFNIIFIVVVILFILTFIFTLLALAGKIKVDQNIQYGLYSALLLEVILVFFGFFKMGINSEYETLPDKSEWVGLNLNSMSLIQPILVRKINNNDSTGIESDFKFDTIQLLGKTVSDARFQLRSTNINSKLTRLGLEIFSTSNETLGIVPKDSLSFFNQINNNEATVLNKFREKVKFESRNKGAWKKQFNFFPEPGYDIKVIDGQDGNNSWMTGYIITQEQKSVVDTLFNSFSKLETKEILNVNNRIIHTYEHNNIFYMMFISSSDTKSESDPRYIYFQQLKLVPGLNTE